MRQVLALACVAAFPLQAAAQPSSRLDDLGWLQGLWTATVGDARLEQYYSPPLGGAIIGVSRSVTPGQQPSIALALLSATSAGVELRLRHFDARLKPVEGAEPLLLRLTQSDKARLAVFTSTAGEPRRVALERGADERLTSRIDLGDGEREIAWTQVSPDLPGGGPAPAADGDALAGFGFLAGHWVSPFIAGEVHEFRLGPEAGTIVAALCRVRDGAATAFELGVLERSGDKLRSLTWQFAPDLKIAGTTPQVEAELSGGTQDKAEFRGTVGPYTYSQTLELAAPDELRSHLTIFKEDGSTLREIELDSTRVSGLPRAPAR